MKIQVAKRDLESVLQVACVSSTSGNDMTSHVLFRTMTAHPDKVEILTYSNRLFASSPVICTVEVEDGGPTAFTVEAKRLKGWLQAVGDAALTLSFKDEVVTAKAPRGKQKLQSLDPAQFPHWDPMLKAAKVTATVPASRLIAALDHAQQFISTDESRRPDICVTEVKDGTMRASNGFSATTVTAKGLEKTKLRIHFRDVSPLLGFLGSFDPDQEVEVLETDRGLLLRRGDGAVMGESRFREAFPNIVSELNIEDQYTCVLPREAVLSNIKFLRPGADWKDPKLRFCRPKAGGPVVMSMKAATGDVVTQEVEVVESSEKAVAEGEDPIPELPDKGFLVHHEMLVKALGTLGEDIENVTFGVNRNDRGGFVRFARKDNDVTFYTVVGWLRDSG